MVEALLGLPAIGLLALLLGGGWAAVLHRAAPSGLLGFLFLSWSVAIGLSSAVWAWVYPAGLGVRFGLVSTLILASAGYLVAWWRRSFTVLQHLGSKSLTGLVLAFGVVLMALVPAYTSWTHLSMGDRIGPDGAGYAISARTISEGVSRPALESQLLTQVGGGSVSAALSPATKRVDTAPSVTTQGASEFLLGADRWGFPGVVGTVLYVLGPSQLWGILTLLAAFGLLTAGIGVWSIVREGTGSRWAPLVALVILGLNCVLLNAWHEGALAQVWVLPACVLFARPLVALGQGDRLGGAISIALGCALMLVAFNDAMLIYPVLFGLCMLFSIPLLGRRWWTTWWPLIAGAAAGAALVSLSTSNFVSTLSRSTHENNTAGWPQPRWLDVAEALGLRNAFGTAIPVLGTRSRAENYVQIGEEVLVVGLFVAVLWRRLREPAVVLLASIVAAAAGVYFKTRYFDHISNYQYFKTIALLVPAGALAIGVLIGRATASSPAAAPSPRARHVRQSGTFSLRRSAVLALSGAMVVAVVIAAASYVFTYRAQGTTVPASFEGLAQSSTAKASFDQFNILSSVSAFPPAIAASRLLTFDLAAEVNLNWIGRNVGSPPTRLGDRKANPVGLVVFEQYCPRFQCLKRIPRNLVRFRSNGVAVVELDRNSRSLEGLSERQWINWAASRFHALGGGQLTDYVPRG